ncbi:APC family permease, partial [Gordonia humi]
PQRLLDAGQPMAEVANTESASQQPTGRLQRNAIGVSGMVFMVVAFAAPLTAMASNLSLSLGFGVGIGTLGWFLVVGLLLAVFTVGYSVLARTVVSAGAYFAYIGHGLGLKAGSAAATIAFISYNLAAAAMAAAAGYFGDIAVQAYTGVELPWPVYSGVAFVVMMAVSYIGIAIASKLTLVVSLIQFALLGALAVKVLLDRPSAFTLEGFEPTAMFGPGLSLTIVFIFLSFGGYEAAAAYGEECSAPERKIKRATFIALGVLLVVFLISTWTLVAAFDDVQAAAAADPAGLLISAANQYLGAAAAKVIGATVAISFFAAAVAIHNMAARYGFALGRAGILPASMAKTHEGFGTPNVASAVQIGTSVSILIPFIVLESDPISSLFPIVSGVTALTIVILMGACSVSVLVASLKGSVTGGVIETRIFPVVSAVGFAFVMALLIVKYEEVTGSDSKLISAMPLILVIGAVVGVVRSRYSTGEISVN